MLLIINYSDSATVYIVALASQLQTPIATRCNSIFLHVYFCTFTSSLYATPQ